jgi:phosphatidylserine/phosphatidylglycerophosphate/cardiolipin synthase-like enzyme
MTDIATLRTKYFAPLSDIAPNDAAFPFQSAGNTVTTLVDGSSYFGALRTEVNALKAPGGTGKFFYFSNWLLTLLADPGGVVTAGSGVTSWDTAQVLPQNPFKLDDGSGAVIPDFLDELAAMAANGTDVRALVWVSPLVMSYQDAAARAGYIYSNNALSARSIHAMRQKPGLANKACLNTLAHPLASMHIKMALCGDASGARAYVSGIDFTNSRFDTDAHPSAAAHGWHDAGIRIEGPGAMGVYGAYRTMWNELIASNQERFRIGDQKIENYVDGTPALPGSPTFSTTEGGSASVQVLRTVPQMNFAIGSTDRAPVGCFKRLVSGFRRDPWAAAPDGIFAFASSLEKAISHAEKYIYVEDQGFWGAPIMEWLRDRLAARPALKLIMAHRADPEDGPTAVHYLTNAINHHLGSAGVDMAGQVAFYARDDQVVMHTKAWIIDDEFLIVGSANAFRRSLYTDGEISIGVIDDNPTATNAAIQFRRQLWGEHCGLHTDVDRAVLTDLDNALKIWDPTWGGVGAAPAALLPAFKRKRVPLQQGAAADQWPSLDLTPLDPIFYDQIDADSRLEY